MGDTTNLRGQAATTAPAQPAPAADSGAERPARDAFVTAGVGLMVVGILMLVVILIDYYAHAAMPSTWAYFVAMLAPAGFAVLLGRLTYIALRRGPIRPVGPARTHPFRND